MRILSVSTSREVGTYDIHTCRFGFSMMRKELLCDTVNPWKMTSDVTMWYDPHAAEKELPVNGPAIRIAEDVNAQPMDHFPDGVVRGGVFLTGPESGHGRFSNLPHCEYFKNLLRED